MVYVLHRPVRGLILTHRMIHSETPDEPDPRICYNPGGLPSQQLSMGTYLWTQGYGPRVSRARHVADASRGICSSTR